VTGRILKGLSSIVSERVRERSEGKTGGVNVVPKKEPCERDPLRELQVLQHDTRLS
jgi:hypothetical protein